MNRLVIDNSVVMSWFFNDEAGPYTEGVLESLSSHMCIVPSIWPLEVANVLLVGQRRGRCSEADAGRFVTLLEALPLSIDGRTSERALHEVYQLAREYSLTSYDAAYLELAMREGIPLATQDKQLRNAASNAGVRIFIP